MSDRSMNCSLMNSSRNNTGCRLHFQRVTTWMWVVKVPLPDPTFTIRFRTQHRQQLLAILTGWQGTWLSVRGDAWSTGQKWTHKYVLATGQKRTQTLVSSSKEITVQSNFTFVGGLKYVVQTLPSGRHSSDVCVLVCVFILNQLKQRTDTEVQVAT